ncbi:MAG: guanitoxin biosynthesis pre-guanitoxin forming N-methyltransferase GntF [bacterium]|nr:guanitoxin biosynthesis pre-guanitoxin forming N-methyltransferase GntF [bacterium]
MDNKIKEQWNVKDYLKQYYTLTKLSRDEVKLFQYIITFLKKFPKNHFENFLDFGSGPVIHRLVPFAPYVRNIFLADYLQSNLKEINFWIKGRQETHDWDDQILHILQIEEEVNFLKKNSYVKNLASRKRLIRSKVRNLYKGNIFNKKPINAKKQFSLLASFYCADSITSSKKQWKSAMQNMLNLVVPRGWVILSALRNTNKYKVGDTYFPSPNINEKDVVRILTENDFDSKTINVKIIPAHDWKTEGIKSLMVIRAQKKDGNC